MRCHFNSAHAANDRCIAADCSWNALPDRSRANALKSINMSVEKIHTACVLQIEYV